MATCRTVRSAFAYIWCIDKQQWAGCDFSINPGQKKYLYIPAAALAACVESRIASTSSAIWSKGCFSRMAMEGQKTIRPCINSQADLGKDTTIRMKSCQHARHAIRDVDLESMCYQYSWTLLVQHPTGRYNEFTGSDEQTHTNSLTFSVISIRNSRPTNASLTGTSHHANRSGNQLLPVLI